MRCKTACMPTCTENLVYYSNKTFDVEPVLATSWEGNQPASPFQPAPGVKFHDGSAFTANVLCIRSSAPWPKTSNFTPYVGHRQGGQVDAQTVDVLLKSPTRAAAPDDQLRT